MRRQRCLHNKTRNDGTQSAAKERRQKLAGARCAQPLMHRLRKRGRNAGKGMRSME